LTHKKHKRKYLNILLIPDAESSPKNIKIRYSLLTVLMVLLIIIFVGLLISIFTYGQLVEKAYENISLKQENEQMQKQLQKINDLSDELNNLKSYGRKVQNSLTGFVKISENTDDLSAISEQEALAKQSMLSVFTSIPIKAPLIGFISQEFRTPLHNGIDIVASEGTVVVASASGIVLYSGWTTDGGNTIIIGHSYGYYSYYKHNLRNLVFNNQKVEQGQPIAYLGNSGQKSFGPHLHFEIWKDGKPINPRDMVLEFNK